MCSQFRTSRSQLHLWTGVIGIAAALWGGAAAAEDLAEPAVFASSHGVLDILMIAEAKPIPTIAFTPPGGGAAVNPTGWVYEVCKRPRDATVARQAADDRRLWRRQAGAATGRYLKVRLVNRLPKIDPAKLKHVTDTGEANLYLNPTNHPHPWSDHAARAASRRDPTFGDYVFLSLFNRRTAFRCRRPRTSMVRS